MCGLGLAANPAQCFRPAPGLLWPQARLIMKPLAPVLCRVTVMWEMVTGAPKKGLGSAGLVSSMGQSGKPVPYPRREEGLRPPPGGRTVHSAL